MERYQAVIMKSVQFVVIFAIPALSLAVSWIGGEREARRLARAGGIGGAIGGIILFGIEQALLPVPFWVSAMRIPGLAVWGALLGVTVAVGGFLFHRRRDL